MPLRKNFDLKNDLIRGREEVKREIVQIGKDLVREVIRYLDENKINFEGDLRKSVDREVKEFTHSIKLRVFAASAHAAPVHEGRGKNKKVPYVKKKDGLAPLQYGFVFLHKWVRKKLGIVTETEIKQIAAAIAIKISKEGTEPKPFMTEALKAIEDSLVPRLQKAFVKGFG